MRFPEHRVERLVQQPERRRIRPHPALLEHHVALGIKFAAHRIQQAVGLQPHPEFDLVRRHVAEINRHILGRERVHAGRAVGGIHFVEFVLHLHRALSGDEVVELLFQFAPARCLVLRLLPVVNLTAPPGRAELDLLGAHFFTHLLLCIDDLQILRVILRADGLGALEHHVLEQMRDARAAGLLIRAADVRHPAAGDGRLVMPLDEEEVEAVGKGLFHDGNFLRAHRQGERGHGKQNEREG